MQDSALVIGASARAARAVPHAPVVSSAAVEPLRNIEAVDESGSVRALRLPIERPLTLVLDGRELVTLMTLGAAPEWLALGYLRNQRLIDSVGAVGSVVVDWSRCRAEVSLRAGRFTADGSAGGRGADGGGAASIPLGCALGTGFLEMIRSAAADAAAAGPPRRDASAPLESVDRRLRRSEILDILEIVREHDAIHRAAGSVHSCALFRATDLWVAVEDVSRHNGIDTIAGFMLLHGVWGGDKILFSTGRLTVEMVMKAAHNGIPVMISRNGATALGYDLAARLGMTLIGRAAKGRYLCYLGAERIDADA